MKPIIVIIALLVAGSALPGCSQGTSGGPGAAPKNAPESSIALPGGQSKDTFSLDVPNLAVSLARGESKAFAIGVRRGSDMRQDVTLKFSDLPAGVSVEPAEAVVAGTATESQLMLKTTAQAPIGDFVIKVTGHPRSGADASNTVKISIAEP